jgi:hypothetical protein
MAPAMERAQPLVSEWLERGQTMVANARMETAPTVAAAAAAADQYMRVAVARTPDLLQAAAQQAPVVWEKTRAVMGECAGHLRSQDDEFFDDDAEDADADAQHTVQPIPEGLSMDHEVAAQAAQVNGKVAAREQRYEYTASLHHADGLVDGRLQLQCTKYTRVLCLTVGSALHPLWCGTD